MDGAIGAHLCLWTSQERWIDRGVNAKRIRKCAYAHGSHQFTVMYRVTVMFIRDLYKFLTPGKRRTPNALVYFYIVRILKF